MKWWQKPDDLIGSDVRTFTTSEGETLKMLTVAEAVRLNEKYARRWFMRSSWRLVQVGSIQLAGWLVLEWLGLDATKFLVGTSLGTVGMNLYLIHHYDRLMKQEGDRD